MNNLRCMEEADEIMKALADSYQMYNCRVQILKVKPDSQDGVKDVKQT